MLYKVICTDIDGTLLGANRALSPKTIHTIGRIKDHVPVILVSSRMPKAMRHLQVELGIEKHPVIAYNGGLILTYDQEEPQVLWSQPIDIQALRIIHQFTGTSPVHISLYTHDDWYVRELDQWALREINNTKVEPTIADFDEVITTWEQQGISPHKIMCMGPEADIHALETFLLQTCGNMLHVYRSKSTYLELASKSISKASAIAHLLQEKWGYTPAAAVAFGDNYNDIEMLKAVGRGIAVANANDALRQVAHEITSSNLEDGVAVAIEKYFL